MKRIWYACVPLWVLLGAISLACILGYFVVLAWGDVSLRKVITKTTQVLLVLSIFPAMRILNVNKVELGFAPRPIFIKQIAQGFGLGFIILAPVFILLYALKVMVFDATQYWTVGLLLQKTVIALFLALLISWVEEPLFRGILLTGLSKKLPLHAAILLSAFYYAILHFLDTKATVPLQEMNMFSGFQLLQKAFINLNNPEIIPALLPLFMVGLFLAVLRTRVPGSLGLCIGCHASWVWQIKMSKSVCNTDFTADYAYLVSHYDGVIGPLVMGWLMVALVGFWVYQRKERFLN